MFDLKYKITEADLKKEEKRTTLMYFSVYGSIGLLGLAVGIVAIVLKPSAALFVLGIIMTALAAVLFLIALLLIMPGKSSVKSVVGVGDTDRIVKIGNDGINVYDENDEIVIGYDFPELNSVKLRDNYIAVYIKSYSVLIVKSNEREELERIYDFLCLKTGKTVKRKQAPTPTKQPEAPAPSDDDKNHSEASNASDEDNNAE